MPQEPVQVHVEWCVLLPQLTPVMEAAHALLAETRNASGCLSCSLDTEIGEFARLHLAEGWQTEAHLHQHLQSASFGRLTGLLESAIAPPRIEFDLPSGRRGLDYAREVIHAR